MNSRLEDVLRDMLSDRGLMAGVVFFVLIVGGTQLYYWRVRHAEAAKVAQTARAVQRLQNTKRTRTVPPRTETFKETQTPLFTDDTNPVIPDETPAFGDEADFTDAFLPDDIPLPDTEDPIDMPVSPYGFGPYPKLPEGWSPDTFPSPSANHELLARVRIKLLSQGIETEGATLEKGLVYPVIKGTIYVEWKERRGPDGVFRFISGMLGHPDDTEGLDRDRPLEEKDIPSDIKLVPFKEGGIDPYTFLDLPQRR